jgi:hypothetical protein
MHYRIVRLRKGRSVWPGSGSLRVDLDAALRDGAAVSDDRGFLAAAGKGDYFWVSGGGTYLINGRYLPVVKRGKDARVNPGKFSLFTGRADSLRELLNPSLLARELFEELVLFRDGRPLRPDCPAFRRVIAPVYRDLSRRFGLKAGEVLPLTPLRGETGRVRLTHRKRSKDLRLAYHVNGRNDVNVLQLFAAQVDVDALSAEDGEYHLEGGRAVKHRREIYLYDVKTSRGRKLSAPAGRRAAPIADARMTEHLLWLVKQVRRGKWR